MFCTKCGKPLVSGAKFCTNCGQEVDASKSSDKIHNKSKVCPKCGSNEFRNLGPREYQCLFCRYKFVTDDEVQGSGVSEQEKLDLYNRASAFRNNKNYTAQLDALLEYRSVLSDDVFYLTKLGRAYSDRGFRQKAIECYEDVIRIDAEYALAYVNIGTEYLDIDNYSSAINYAEKGVRLIEANQFKYSQSDYKTALVNYSLALARLGRKDEAIKALKKAEDNGYKNGKALRKRLGLKRGLFA